MGVAQQFDERTPKSKGRTALSKKTVRLKSKGRSARLQKKWYRDRLKGQICPGAEKETFDTTSPVIFIGTELPNYEFSLPPGSYVETCTSFY